EQRPEGSRAKVVRLPVGHVGERIVPLRIRRGFEDDAPERVVWYAQRRVGECLTVQPIAAAELLQAADEQRRSARADAIRRVALAGDAHRVAIEALGQRDARLLEDIAAYRKAAAVVTAGDA